MKTIKKMFWGMALLAGFATLSNTASADDAQCASSIMITAYHTEAAEFYGRNGYKSEAMLMGKLEEAMLKLSEGKYIDVVAKLNDYQLALIAMADAAKPKINVVDAYGEDLVADGVGGLDGDASTAISYCSL